MLPSVNTTGKATELSFVKVDAQTVPGITANPPQTLTLQQAIELSLKNSPRMSGAAAVSARAEAGVRTAGAYTNPQLEVYEGNQSARRVPTPGVPGLLQHYAAYQTVELPQERRARLLTARLGRTSSGYGRAGVALSTVADTKHAFYDVLRRRQEVDHTNQNLALVQDLRRRVDVQVRVGEIGRLELTRAEAELARAHFMVRTAQLELAHSIAQLRVAIAAPPDMNLDPHGQLESPVRLQPIEELRKMVLRMHPAIAQAETDVSQAEANLIHERALRLPQPTFFGEYERQPDLSFWRLGVNLPLPLWSRREGQIADSAAAIRQTKAFSDEKRLEINAALERAYEQYQLADQQVSALESGSLHEAESAVNAAKAAYRFGERGILEVLDAQRVLQGVRGDLLDAQFERQSALVDLEELGAVNTGGRP